MAKVKQETVLFRKIKKKNEEENDALPALIKAAKPELRSNSFVKFYQSKNATHVADREKSENLV